jgi:RHS repeat-associated protein
VAPPTQNALPRFVYYHLDHLGTPRVITDISGFVVSKHHYMPFGEEMPFVAENTTGTRQFTGHERDSESQMDYMVGRYYSPPLGRMQTPDPGPAHLLVPGSLNRYTYAWNNPLRVLDPTGRSSVTFVLVDQPGLNHMQAIVENTATGETMGSSVSTGKSKMTAADNLNVTQLSVQDIAADYGAEGKDLSQIDLMWFTADISDAEAQAMIDMISEWYLAPENYGLLGIHDNFNCSNSSCRLGGVLGMQFLSGWPNTMWSDLLNMLYQAGYNIRGPYIEGANVLGPQAPPPEERPCTYIWTDNGVIVICPAD